MPPARLPVMNVAVPPFRTAVPSVFGPSRNVTVPVGVPAPGATALTVAVNDTTCPAADGFGADVSVVVVEEAFTV